MVGKKKKIIKSRFFPFRFGRRGLFGSAGSLFMASSITIASIYGYYDIDSTAMSKWDAENVFGYVR